MEAKKQNLKDQSIFLILGNTFRQGAVMIQGMLLARLLTPADFGSFRQVVLVTTIIYTFTYLSLSESCSYFLARLNPLEKRKFTFQTFIAFLIMGTLAFLIMVFGRGMIAAMFHNNDLVEMLLISSIIPISMMFSVFMSVALVTIGKAQISSLVSIIFAIFTAGLICMVIAMGYPLITALWVYSGFYVLEIIVSLILVIKYIGIKPNFDINMLKDQMSFSIPYWLSYSIFFLYMQVHKVLVSTFFTPDEFALFSVGATELPVIGQMASQIALVLIPVSVQLMMSGDTGRIIKLWEKSATKVAMITIPVFMILMFNAQEFLQVVWGGDYGKAWPIFVIVLFLMPLRICNISSMFKITGTTRYVIYVSLAALVVGLGFGYFLIKPLGLLGPAIGVVLGRITQILVGLIFIRKSLPITLGQSFAFNNLWKITLAGFLASAFAKVILWNIHWPLLNLLLNAAIGAVIFIFITLKFKILTDEDAVLIKKWITLKPILKNP